MKTAEITVKRLKGVLGKRGKDCHKGDFGRVLIIAGSRGMPGAGVLAAKAALKAGAGLVTLAVPESQQQAACAVPELLIMPLPESGGAVNASAAEEILKRHAEKNYDLAVIGPGLSCGIGVSVFVRTVLRRLKTPFIVDADALNAAAAGDGLRDVFPREIPCILTPHPGEMRRLMAAAAGPQESDRIDTAVKLSFETGKVVVYKGYRTVITDAVSVFINPTGNPALAKAGVGDVLSGLIAGFWAQHGKAAGGFTLSGGLECACLGVYIHGLCADLAQKELTERCVLAGELLNYLPKALRKINPKL